jgi:glycosyltransferase involved in cell wall biosynthesis
MLEGVAKWHALRTCSALVMPSHQENFGLVAVEALACGPAVLISEKVDISPVIIKYKAGISDSDNEAGIEKMLRTWLDMSLEERQKMKVNARNLFLDQFEIRKTANRFKQLLEEKVI